VEDLGIDGDDADDLYFDLLDNYGVDLKVLGNIGHYFHAEGELLSPFYIFKSLLCKSSLSNNPPIQPLVPLCVADPVAFVRKKA
jgi:hypothetical protein